MEDLDPCPFCGEIMSPMYAEIRSDGDLIGYDVTCYDCGACGPRSETKQGAANAWNRRFTLLETEHGNG